MLWRDMLWCGMVQAATFLIGRNGFPQHLSRMQFGDVFEGERCSRGGSSGHAGAVLRIIEWGPPIISVRARI